MRRMRKLCLCLMMLLLSASSMNVFAEGESKVVQGKTVFQKAEHVYEAEIKDDKGSVTTADGVVIEIEGDDLDGCILRVVELFEGDEAFAWLQGETTDGGILKAAYDVLLEDTKGNFVTPGKEFAVTIRYAQNETGLKVLHVSSQGVKEELKPERSTREDGELLTIQGTKLDYYTFLRTSGNHIGDNGQESGGQNNSGSSAGGDTGNSGTTTTIPVSQVKTGDPNDAGLSLLILFFSILVGVLIIRKLRREEL